MKKPEGKLWQRMRPGIEPFAFAQRIENLVGEGVPDVALHSRIDGCAAWVELKCRPIDKMPARADTPIFKGDCGLRPEQIAWLHARSKIGARCWILAQGGETLWLVHGRYARELETWSIATLHEYCFWKEPARKTNWGKICEFIFC